MKAPIDEAKFGLTADDYVKYRAGFPQSLFTRLESSGIGIGNQQILDLGTGTGTLGRGFALNNNIVTGIDPAIELLNAAKGIDKKLSIETNYHVAHAEETGLATSSFDVVTAGQCWHWFEPLKASREIQRLLKPNGVFVVAYYDWLPLSGNVVRQTEALIEKYNPSWKAGNQFGIYPQIFRDLGESGFHSLESFTYDEAAIYTHEGWRGRIRASAGVGATMKVELVQRFDVDLSALLKKYFPEEPMAVPHRVFTLLARF